VKLSQAFGRLLRSVRGPLLSPAMGSLTRVGTPPNLTTSPYPGNQVPANRFDNRSQFLMSKFFPALSRIRRGGHTMLKE
jgi:hypothetical protein